MLIRKSINVIVVCLTALSSAACCGETPLVIEQNHRDVARYGHMRFHGGTEAFRFFHTGSRDGDPVADIYLRVNKKDIYFLPTLKEEDIADSVRTRLALDERNVVKYKRTGFYSFWFRDGKLLLAYFNLYSGPFEIGPTKEGPFEGIPIERARMIELFGEPKSWGKARIAAP